MPINKQILTPETVRQAAYGLMTPDQLECFKQRAGDRFRDLRAGARPLPRQRVLPARLSRDGAALHQRRHAELDQLGLPDMLKDLIMLKRGLMLMVGATGSGKSTTLAAMINHRNENFSDHILTIEDPIEFLHTNKQVDRQPARSRPRHASRSRARCAAPCAPRRTSS